MAQTLYDKLWNSHSVHTEDDGTTALYIDRHLLHEVTSPQAFEGLKVTGRSVWRISANLAVSDHNVPTTDRSHEIADPASKLQIDTLDANCDAFGIMQFKMNDMRQGIVHIIGPEQRASLPGMTIVCGDSRTSTHGAFGALAQGIGTSEVEHVPATQTLLQKKSKYMLVKVEGDLPGGCTAKDVVLAIIGKLRASGGAGYAIEFGGSTICGLSMEGRTTVCNMTMEADARVGMIAVDDTTVEYLKGCLFSPQGIEWDRAVEYWKQFKFDPDAHFDCSVELDAAQIVPKSHGGRLRKW
jgi:3-isopropylmalate/(R)-2-methylmalate dehydratase large subunit